MKHANPAWALAIAIILLPLAGCGGPTGRSVNLSAWQNNVDHYVKEQGEGDPTALRDVTLPDGRKGYEMIGTPIMKDSTDAVGLLVGVPPIGGKPAFVYLVGINDKGKVSDIRLAVATVNGGGLHWDIGRSNPTALQTYLKYRQAQWREDLPARKEPPLLAENFPAPSDVFTLSVEPGRLTAVHQATKAAWTVSLTGSR